MSVSNYLSAAKEKNRVGEFEEVVALITGAVDLLSDGAYPKVGDAEFLAGATRVEVVAKECLCSGPRLADVLDRLSLQFFKRNDRSQAIRLMQNVVNIRQQAHDAKPDDTERLVALVDALEMLGIWRAGAEEWHMARDAMERAAYHSLFLLTHSKHIVGTETFAARLVGSLRLQARCSRQVGDTEAESKAFIKAMDCALFYGV